MNESIGSPYREHSQRRSGGRLASSHTSAPLPHDSDSCSSAHSEGAAATPRSTRHGAHATTLRTTRAYVAPPAPSGVTDDSNKENRTAFSLQHPVIQFLSTVRLQGYVREVLEEHELLTMAQLTAYVTSEDRAANLLGPHAVRQHIQDLFKGVQKYEREQAREAKQAIKLAQQQRRALAKRPKGKRAAQPKKRLSDGVDDPNIGCEQHSPRLLQGRSADEFFRSFEFDSEGDARPSTRRKLDPSTASRCVPEASTVEEWLASEVLDEKGVCPRDAPVAPPAPPSENEGESPKVSPRRFETDSDFSSALQSLLLSAQLKGIATSQEGSEAYRIVENTRKVSLHELCGNDNHAMVCSDPIMTQPTPKESHVSSEKEGTKSRSVTGLHADVEGNDDPLLSNPCINASAAIAGKEASPLETEMLDEQAHAPTDARAQRAVEAVQQEIQALLEAHNARMCELQGGGGGEANRLPPSVFLRASLHTSFVSPAPHDSLVVLVCDALVQDAQNATDATLHSGDHSRVVGGESSRQSHHTPRTSSASSSSSPAHRLTVNTVTSSRRFSQQITDPTVNPAIRRNGDGERMESEESDFVAPVLDDDEEDARAITHLLAESDEDAWHSFGLNALEATQNEFVATEGDATLCPPNELEQRAASASPPPQPLPEPETIDVEAFLSSSTSTRVASAEAPEDGQGLVGNHAHSSAPTQSVADGVLGQDSDLLGLHGTAHRQREDSCDTIVLSPRATPFSSASAHTLSPYDHDQLHELRQLDKLQRLSLSELCRWAEQLGLRAPPGVARRRCPPTASEDKAVEEGSGEEWMLDCGLDALRTGMTPSPPPDSLSRDLSRSPLFTNEEEEVVQTVTREDITLLLSQPHVIADLSQRSGSQRRSPSPISVALPQPTAKELAALQREWLMDAIQAVAVQHYFQCDVVPHFLHRVGRFSHLPYKRLRPADFLGRSRGLSAADTKVAKQQEYTELVRCVEASLMADSVEQIERGAVRPRGPDADDGPDNNLTTYERVLLLESTDAEVAATTVKKDFEHITYHRVQHLLEESGIPLEAVRRVPPPSPPPPGGSWERDDSNDEGEEEERSIIAAPAQGTPETSRSRSASPPPHMTPVQRQRENTRLYFASKGLPTRRGVLPFRKKN